MSILLFGISHVTAPVEVRECLALTHKQQRWFLDALRSGKANPQLNGHRNGSVEPSALQGAAVLSTCGRLETYLHGDDLVSAEEQVLATLDEVQQFAALDPRPYFYRYTDERAVRHLFRVTAGLDSFILGESQILGQVSAALEQSLAVRACDGALSTLFRQAIETGRRVRHETGLGRGSASVASAALQLARQVRGGDLNGAAVLIVGAGEMGELTAQLLLSQGSRTVIIVNRTHERAVELARRWGGEVYRFDELERALSQADIVIASTAAPRVIVTQAHVAAAMRQRENRPLHLIDIAVPRNVDPIVGQLAGVTYHDVDTLQSVLAEGLMQRRAAVPAAAAIVEEHVAAFMHWYRSLEVVPTIKELRGRADGIRQAELEKALRRLGPLSERDQEVIAALSKGIVNKILHEPTVRLKEHAGSGDGRLYDQALRELFDLDLMEND